VNVLSTRYVQLVYGRQLQQQHEQAAGDPLDVASMTIEQRAALKRRIRRVAPIPYPRGRDREAGTP
jgi:hypothetical protein